MFQHNRVPVWPVAVVAALIVVAIASASHSAGWSQGYTMGLLAAGGDSARLTPYLIYRAGGGLGPWGFGGFFGLILRFGFFAFLLAMVVKFVAFRRRHIHGPWHPLHGCPWSDDHQDPAQAQQDRSAAGHASQPNESNAQNTAWINV